MTTRAIRRAAERNAQKFAPKAVLLQTPQAASAPQDDPPAHPRVAANRANSQLSTGPRSAEGKAKVSLNAVKTGLTGRTVLLPSDEAADYEALIVAYEKEFQPVGAEESALVQSLLDIRWRLNRIPGLEMAIYALGRVEFAEMFEHHPAAERTPFTDLETLTVHEKQLRNLHLQESRLARRREKELAELRRLQQERKSLDAAEPATAAMATPLGFVFSTCPGELLTPHLAALGDNITVSQDAEIPLQIAA